MQEYKIITFGLFDAHKHGNILEKLYQFRYQGFVIEEKNDLIVYNDAEFCIYDNPFAKYVVVMNGDEIVACAMLNRTDIPYMAKDCWSHLIPKKVLPNDANFYEWTRQYVSSKLSTVERVKMVRIISTATYFALIESKAMGVCCACNHLNFIVMNKLGIPAKLVAIFDIPNFPNIHFVHVDVNVEDAKVVAKNLLEMMGFDILLHFNPINLWNG